MALAVALGGAWLALRPQPAGLSPPGQVAVVPPLPQPGPRAGAPAFAIRDASEAEILENRDGGLVIFRFRPNPRILVLDFADLSEQGRMLNRVAALVEKAGLPRDRLLDDTELDAAIRAHGDRPETYYYGHDYSAAALARFFALAERDRVALTPQEQMLRLLLAQEGYLQPGALGGIISIPRAGADPFVDLGARATILHHELSHGEYFSNPAYAAYARAFWSGVLTEAERAAFIRYLAHEDYDPSQEDLMINEMQAYLMHTPDRRFFDPGTLGLPVGAVNRLQATFLLGMPAGWLRDGTSVPPPVEAASAPAPASLPASPPPAKARGAPAR
ncbi:hypothetical protein [Limobrevibacterium gyesilva]|uniref:Uncharacterized protein n=1 Tax=Limobrevibacterium gyesilva TaxID=2991712 RepID=A0AA41YIT0_9PROT|nr:hypothetical protein [Limobrevibacterium gyesilva]MCW3473889.1 hypothetical protein [Limobrevibacterium gyesilva]